MTAESAATEAVVRNHLRAFLEQRGIAAILDDYAEAARFYTADRLYRGKQDIHGFFVDFIGALPVGAIENFSLGAMLVDGDVALITWTVGDAIGLGTDTFVVHDGKIVTQTFAMYAGAAR